jgi:membrane protease YdiL (CAAX protease family)
VKVIAAIVRIELKTLLRDPSILVTYALTFLLALLILPGLHLAKDTLSESETPATEASPKAAKPSDDTPPCDASLWSRIAVENPDALPDDIPWPVPFAQASNGDLQLRVVHNPKKAVPTLRLSSRDGDTDLSEAEDCLDAWVGEVRAHRLAALGLPAFPRRLASIPVTGPKRSQLLAIGADDVSQLGSLVGSLAFIFGLSLALEAVPRRRQSGLLEQLRSTQTPELTLVLGWLAALTLAGIAASLLGGIGYLITAVFYGGLEGAHHALHAPAMTLFMAALAIRVALHAENVLSATLRTAVIGPLLMVTTGGAFFLLDTPWLAALVPLGGAVLAAAGTLGAWGFLADFAAVVYAGVLVTWSARSLAAEVSVSPGVDPTLMRRAKGRYLPEVILLTSFALSCGVLSGGHAFEGHPWVGITLGFVTLMLLPALLTAPILALDSRTLLALTRPKPRDLALSVPVVMGLVGLSSLIMAASFAILPTNALTQAFIEQITALVDSPLAALGLSVYPALCEELLFRGAILGLLLRGGNTRLAIVGQAAAFAVVHIIPVRLPWTFAMGLILGWVRVRTGSLWPCVALHLLFNLLMGVMSLMWPATAVLPSVEVSTLLYALPLLLGLGVLPLYSRGETPVSADEPT